jgi:replicative DNA helicase
VSREVPQDAAAEEALIGACLLAHEAIANSRDVVTPSDFFNRFHGQIYETMLHLVDAGESVDVVSVSDAFPTEEREQSIVEMARLQNQTPAISNASRYARQVLLASQQRALIFVGADLTDAGYEHTRSPGEVAERYSEVLANHELLRRHGGGSLVGYYPDIATIDVGADREEAQPWIARGVLRRNQRLLVVARAGLGKSTLLRQLAFCAVNGVHPLTEQPTERKRRALIIELEAGLWDISDSMRDILMALRRSRQLHSAFDLERPALLHRPGGLDIRSPEGRSAVELAIQRAEPDLVVMGPIKYMFAMKPGENYEIAALAVHGILNDMMDRYRFALALEAHFSRGDHGAPGGSERWVDWPDVGFGLHPPEEAPIPPPPSTEMTVTQFRNPRDSKIYFPPKIMRGIPKHLPWLALDDLDPARPGRSLFAERYGGVREADYEAFEQADLVSDPVQE